VCRYVLKAALNFDLSFLRIVTLGGKLLKTFMPACCENKIGWHLVCEDFALSQVPPQDIDVVCKEHYEDFVMWSIVNKTDNVHIT